jgi:hypothetical protein
MPVCDGCGTRVDDAHIRRRIERLELATRFRPIHIRVLLIDAAPPERPEDFFYRAAKDRSVRSVASRMYFDELAKLVGAPTESEADEESLLMEFQRQGYFLTYAIECPVGNQEPLDIAMRRLAPTIMKRIQSSYQPKYVAPLSLPTREVVRLFGLVGWQDRLVLDGGGPFADPFLGDPQNQAEFGTALGDRLTKALSHLV